MADRAAQASGTTGAPSNLGRTATYEVGHSLNLLRIWGDDGMGYTGIDQVDDTQNQAGANTGSPSLPHILCGNGPEVVMFVNFMDYVDDRCMVMFPVGQTVRMHAALDLARSSFSKVKPQPGPTAGWFHTDLTLAAGAPEAAGEPVLDSWADGKLCVLYLGVYHHIDALRVSDDGTLSN
jgi:Pregnancy-associated plasma protein-A